MKFPTLDKIEVVAISVGVLAIGYMAYRAYSAGGDAVDAISNSSLGQSVGGVRDAIVKAFQPSVDTSSPRAIENDIDRENDMLIRRAMRNTGTVGINPALADAEWRSSEQNDRSVRDGLKFANTDDQIFSPPWIN